MHAVGLGTCLDEPDDPTWIGTTTNAWYVPLLALHGAVQCADCPHKAILSHQNRNNCQMYQTHVVVPDVGATVSITAKCDPESIMTA